MTKRNVGNVKLASEFNNNDNKIKNIIDSYLNFKTVKFYHTQIRSFFILLRN